MTVSQTAPAIKSFAFHEELVRATVRDDDPWFVGVDVCRVLGLRNESQALGRLDDCDRAEVCIAYPSGSKTLIVISLAGAFDLILVSRKPNAREIKRWLTHEVLPALYKNGSYSMRVDPDLPADPAGEAMLHRLHVIREARILFGPERARSLWRQLGLPAVPPPPAGPVEEARACLRHLLDHPAHEGGLRVRDLLALALDDDEEARLTLLSCGVRVLPELDAFAVANQHPRLQQIFKPTSWCGPLGWMRVLRRLPGVEAGRQMRWPGPFTAGSPVMRSTLFKGEWLDADA